MGYTQYIFTYYTHKIHLYEVGYTILYTIHLYEVGYAILYTIICKYLGYEYEIYNKSAHVHARNTVEYRYVSFLCLSIYC